MLLFASLPSSSSSHLLSLLSLPRVCLYVQITLTMIMIMVDSLGLLYFFVNVVPNALCCCCCC